MRNLVVARRYAKALYELANETKTVDDVLLGMSNLSVALKTVPLLNRVLVNPLINLEEKEAIVKGITSNKLILKFISLLGKRKRLDLLEAVQQELSSLSDAEKGIHRVLVRTATPLTDVEKKSVEKSLAASFGGLVLGQFEVAKELIGGVWIKMGDKVLDATLKGQMDDLKFVLTHSIN